MCRRTYLLQDEFFFWRSGFCDWKVSQETLKFHQIGQLIHQNLSQEPSELRHIDNGWITDFSLYCFFGI